MDRNFIEVTKSAHVLFVARALWRDTVSRTHANDDVKILDFQRLLVSVVSSTVRINEEAREGCLAVVCSARSATGWKRTYDLCSVEISRFCFSTAISHSFLFCGTLHPVHRRGSLSPLCGSLECLLSFSGALHASLRSKGVCILRVGARYLGLNTAS
eukprot:IDg13794t1